MLLNSLGQQISTYLLTLWICEILNTKIILLFFGFLDQNEIVILALFETIKKTFVYRKFSSFGCSTIHGLDQKNQFVLKGKKSYN